MGCVPKVLTWLPPNCPSHPSFFGAVQSRTHVAAVLRRWVSQRSLGHADSALPEATGASQSDEEASEEPWTWALRTSCSSVQLAPPHPAPKPLLATAHASAERHTPHLAFLMPSPRHWQLSNWCCWFVSITQSVHVRKRTFVTNICTIILTFRQHIFSTWKEQFQWPHGQTGVISPSFYLEPLLNKYQTVHVLEVKPTGWGHFYTTLSCLLNKKCITWQKCYLKVLSFNNCLNWLFRVCNKGS